MVNSMYWISDLTFAATLLIIYIRNNFSINEPNNLERAFNNLVLWVTFFCLQDSVWGLTASDLIMNNTALFVSSVIFHLSSVVTVYVWIKYVLSYMGDDVAHPKLLISLAYIIIAIEVLLLIINFFQPTIFYIDENCIYNVAPLRFVGFMNQYILFFMACLGTGIAALNRIGTARERYKTICIISSAPVLIGSFQYLFPEAPFHSISYFLSVITAHSFIVMEDRTEMERLKRDKAQVENELKIAEQKLIANTDKMTGCYNRRAYEDEITMLTEKGIPDDLVYVSADVNGLKTVNDTLGHAAGDELLKGAVYCMNTVMEKYGKLFRIGGDEFVGIIYAQEHELKIIKQELDRVTFNWSGDMVKSLAVSFGFVEKRECPNISLIEMEKLADQRMYKAKQEYYTQKGIDRRSQHSAYEALCASYEKILKINLTTDSSQTIAMEQEERHAMYGFSAKISDWFSQFSKSGNIHPDDVDIFMEFTSMEYLRNRFASGKNIVSLTYRRKIINRDGWHQVLMEMVRAEDYSDTDQSLYLYVKALDK